MQLWGRNAHFLPSFSVGKSKKNIQKAMGKVDEFQNILREKVG